MFDNQTTGQGNAPAPGADDIFSGLDQGGAPSPAQPQAQFSVEDSNLASQVPTSADAVQATASKRLIVVGGVVVGLLVLSVGIWFALMNIKSKSAAETPADQAKVETADNNAAAPAVEAPAGPQDPNAPAVTGNSLAIEGNSTNTSDVASSGELQGATTTSANLSASSMPVEPAKPTTPAPSTQNSDIPEAVKQAAMGQTDSDGDGLNDEEEKQLGTYADRVDTDSDGLSDYEEVKTYLTNPKNQDTDGDSFKDGDEVKNGYNPKGAGKLVR